MTRMAIQHSLFAVLLFAPVVAALAVEAPTADPRYTWNLQELYPSEAAWVAA